ncbi:dolichyl-phosphate-mannose--protein mannosyltransferase [Nesterenkonia flava]|uniref:Polyprenol-phosphate-mannose--protein mannosyltransferase n=1 Tax=Nesterenkonia flava TaxID=469799 RepID=A0ABU1FQ22_9MICC|nr:phospholipid carrier-dependent glycosyltransferase [Nesterenkonia flava]MDR5710746.1 phospholipid carrier-dependent glycosyltransferase [Nesterenkonia flava]
MSAFPSSASSASDAPGRAEADDAAAEAGTSTRQPDSDLTGEAHSAVVPAASAPARERQARLELRLGADRFSPGLLGWVVPALITVLAGVLRLRELGNPHLLIFDETYYAKDAYALLTAGYELTWPEGANDAWLAGDPAPTDEHSFVVHPPLGKWLIALGIHAFGIESAFGWRVSAAVAGTLGVLLIALIAQRMFRSVFLGGVAGALTAVEGHHLVMSRVALLDIFLMLLVLAAFGALLMDRYQTRRRLAQWASQTPSGSPAWRDGPWLAFRPWQLAAAVLLGAAVGVKLSGAAFLAVFGIMVVLWDLEARRTLGIQHWVRSGLLRNGLPAVLTVVPVALLTYVATWSGWLVTSGGWGRHWHEEHPATGLASLVPGPLRSLWNYHTASTDFHQGLESGHEYASSPWTWLLMGRPVSMHYESVGYGEIYQHTGVECAVEECRSQIVDLANPLIWWAGLIALVVVVLMWLGRRDWRYGAILSGYVAGYAVWLLFPDRTMFFFYTISFHPFVILALVAVAALVLRLGTGPRTREGQLRSEAAIVSAQQRNSVLVLCFVMLCLAVSVFFWPLWTAEPIPTEQWEWRLWMDSWL